MPDRPDDKTHHITAQVLSERNFPVGGAIRIPPELVRDIDQIMVEWRKTRPTVTYEQALRYIWAHGLDALRTALVSRTVPDPVDIRPPRPALFK